MIDNDQDLTAALARVDQIWGPSDSDPDLADELDALAAEIDVYETARFPPLCPEGGSA